MFKKIFVTTMIGLSLNVILMFGDCSSAEVNGETTNDTSTLISTDSKADVQLTENEEKWRYRCLSPLRINHLK